MNLHFLVITQISLGSALKHRIYSVPIIRKAYWQAIGVKWWCLFCGVRHAKPKHVCSLLFTDNLLIGHTFAINLPYIPPTKELMGMQFRTEIKA